MIPPLCRIADSLIVILISIRAHAEWLCSISNVIQCAMASRILMLRYTLVHTVLHSLVTLLKKASLVFGN